MTRPKPTDDQIVEALQTWGSSKMTYVVANVLRSMKLYGETAWVRRQLQRMEREGIVERVPSAYAVQICWRVKP